MEIILVYIILCWGGSDFFFFAIIHCYFTLNTINEYFNINEIDKICNIKSHFLLFSSSSLAWGSVLHVYLIVFVVRYEVLIWHNPQLSTYCPTKPEIQYNIISKSIPYKILKYNILICTMFSRF